MTTPAATPGLTIGPDGDLTVAPSGSWQWIVHHRPDPVCFLASPLAALVGAEELDTSVAVAASCSAVVTAQGPTSLIKTDGAAVYRHSLHVGAGAHLTYLPWVSIPFEGAVAHLETRFSLDPEGTLVAWESMSVGRVAMGERFRFSELRTRVSITIDNEIVLDERNRLRGDDHRACTAAIGAHTHFGSVYVVGIPESALSVADARQLMEGSVLIYGVDRPHPLLLVARALDRSAERLEQGFWPLVEHVRRVLGLWAFGPPEIGRRWF